jgi:oligosaccharide repeat unit polymerase
MLEALYLLLFLLALTNIHVLKVINRSYYNPASLLNMFWVLYVFLPIVMVGVEYTNPYAILYIEWMMLIFSLPFYLSINYKHSTQVAVDIGGLGKIIKLLTPLVLATQLCLIFYESGLGLSSLIDNPIGFANSYASLGYSDQLNKSAISSFLLILVYVLPVLGGLYYSMSNKIIFALYTLLPSVSTLIMQSTKGIFLYCIALFFGGVFGGIVINRNKIPLRGAIRSVVVSVALVFGLLFYAFFVRGLQDSESNEYIKNSISESILAYSSGHIYAFGDWFYYRYQAPSKIHYREEEFRAGFLTFNGLFKFTDEAKELPAGFYDEYYKPTGTWETNVYSVFRGLISDFGLYGSMLFFLFLGTVMKVVFTKMRDSFCVYSFSLYAVFVGFSYQSFVISSFSWLLNFLVPVVLFLILKRVIKYEKNIKEFL